MRKLGLPDGLFADCSEKLLAAWRARAIKMYPSDFRDTAEDVRITLLAALSYWHVERKNVCIYSQLKSCSSSEVAAMIEGLLRHCTDAEIESNYVDTHRASVVGFAFTELLNFRLLPGLKNIGSVRLYRPRPAGRRSAAP